MELLTEAVFIKGNFFALFYFVTIIYFFRIMTDQRKLLFIILALLWAPLVSLWFYSDHIPEYYFLSSVPIFIIISSYVFYHIAKKSKLVFVPLVLLIAFYNFSQFGKIKESPIPISTKLEVVDTIIARSKDKSFEVNYILPLGLNTGYTYLFKWRNNSPKTDGEDLYIVTTDKDSDSIYENSLEKFPTREVQQLKIRKNVHIVSVR